MKTARIPKSPYYYRKARKTPFDLAHPIRFHQAYNACEMYARKNFPTDQYFQLRLTSLWIRLRFVRESQKYQAILANSMRKFASDIDMKRKQIEMLGRGCQAQITQNNKTNR